MRAGEGEGGGGGGIPSEEAALLHTVLEAVLKGGEGGCQDRVLVLEPPHSLEDEAARKQGLVARKERETRSGLCCCAALHLLPSQHSPVQRWCDPNCPCSWFETRPFVAAQRCQPGLVGSSWWIRRCSQAPQ